VGKFEWGKENRERGVCIGDSIRAHTASLPCCFASTPLVQEPLDPFALCVCPSPCLDRRASPGSALSSLPVHHSPLVPTNSLHNKAADTPLSSLAATWPLQGTATGIAAAASDAMGAKSPKARPSTYPASHAATLPCARGTASPSAVQSGTPTVAQHPKFTTAAGPDAAGTIVSVAAATRSPPPAAPASPPPLAPSVEAAAAAATVAAPSTDATGTPLLVRAIKEGRALAVATPSTSVVVRSPAAAEPTSTGALYFSPPFVASTGTAAPTSGTPSPAQQSQPRALSSPRGSLRAHSPSTAPAPALAPDPAISTAAMLYYAPLAVTASSRATSVGGNPYASTTPPPLGSITSAGTSPARVYAEGRRKSLQGALSSGGGGYAAHSSNSSSASGSSGGGLRAGATEAGQLQRASSPGFSECECDNFSYSVAETGSMTTTGAAGAGAGTGSCAGAGASNGTVQALAGDEGADEWPPRHAQNIALMTGPAPFDGGGVGLVTQKAPVSPLAGATRSSNTAIAQMLPVDIGVCRKTSHS